MDFTKMEKLCEHLEEFYPNLQCRAETIGDFKSIVVDFYPFGYLASVEMICHGEECFIAGDIPVPRKDEEAKVNEAKQIIKDRRCFLEDDHIHATSIHIHPICHAKKGNGKILLDTIISELILKGKGEISKF